MVVRRTRGLLAVLDGEERAFWAERGRKVPKTKCPVISARRVDNSLAVWHTSTTNAMGVRASIVVCVTSFLLGGRLHPFFLFLISFPRFSRFSIYPLDRGLIDAVEVTRHRRASMDCRLILLDTDERASSSPLHPVRHRYPRWFNHLLELPRW